MRLERIIIENYRRISSADISLAPASFVIGPNNCGKSSVISAIDALLSLEKEKVSPLDFREQSDGTRAETITLTGYFGSIPPEVARSRGFRGRVINGVYTYKKTFPLSGKVKIECLEYPSTIKGEFNGAKTIGDLIDAGISETDIKEIFDDTDRSTKLKKGWEKDFPDALDYLTEEEPIWVNNPGGIPTVVQSKLPKVMRIPSFTDINDIQSSDKKYIIGECLAILFDDLISQTPLAGEIQDKLNQLQEQMDPKAEDSLIRNLCTEVNKIISDVFPECGIKIQPSLQGVSDILKPKYQINLSSNITTDADHQGTGLIRTTAFAMLRYHSRMKIEKALQTRPILVAFEEPEIYLHPLAANLLRDTIYDLGKSDQIVCTTHSPWMIDLSKEPLSLTRMYESYEGSVSAINYGISTALGKLEPDDRERVKMLQIFDDELSRVFFSERVAIVEGDSELLAIKNTIKLLPNDVTKTILSKYQVVKARGKASIISLVKYLKDLNMAVYVMHDRDKGVTGAECFNEHIANAIDDADKLVVLVENLENAIGYEPQTYDKPYRVFKKSLSWSSKENVPEAWRIAFCKLFQIDWPE